MSDTTWRCGRCGIGGLGLPVGHLCMDDWLLPSPATVPASDLQRALSERDEARAQAAEMRLALERLFRVGDAHDAQAWNWESAEAMTLASAVLSSSAGAGWLSPEEAEKLRAEAAVMRRALETLVAERLPQGLPDDEEVNIVCLASEVREAASALSSSAGRVFLEEMEGLRKERDELRAIPSGLFDALDAVVTALEAAGLRSDLTKLARAVMRGEPEGLDDARAESADLRSRLEATEKERDQARSERQREYEARVTARGSVEAWEDYHTAEVRRAVEEETERIVRLLRAQASRWESDTPVRHALEVAASAILAQGKGAEK